MKNHKTSGDALVWLAKEILSREDTRANCAYTTCYDLWWAVSCYLEYWLGKRGLKNPRTLALPALIAYMQDVGLPVPETIILWAPTLANWKTCYDDCIDIRVAPEILEEVVGIVENLVTTITSDIAENGESRPDIWEGSI